ncbi:MAG: hypothetical protein KJ950_13290 [Proteobacteria bacterium]|nr:hypothetical protein [Pseudomonadota bacterium]MBU1686151.1 hypothetical protein [Pseudomonadota bacterium]
MRNILFFILFLMITWALAQPADARPKNRLDATTKTCRVLESGPLEWASRPWGEGGKAFKEVCQGCHFKGNDRGATFLWVESKTSAAWNRVFEQKYPKCAKDGSWEVLDPEQKMRVNDYLFRWGKNSQSLGDNC